MNNKTFKKAVALFTSVLVVFMFVFSPAFVATPRASAGSSFADGVKGCAASWLSGYLTNKLSGFINGLGGSMGMGGGGNSVPVNDSEAIKAQNKGNSVGKTGNEQYKIKEFVKDCMAWWLAKRLEANMTSQIVGWVNSANSGPYGDYAPSKMILNYGDYFGRHIAQASNQYINKLDSGVTLDPEFAPYLKSKLLQDTYGDPTTNLNYTFPQKYQGFESDFSKGGRSAYQSFIQPQNNPFGSYLIASNQLNKTQQNAERNAEVSVTSSGFPPVRACAARSSNGVCLHYTVKTPGILVEQQLHEALGSQYQQLNMADELNEVLAAYFQHIATKVFGGGGLSGFSPSAPGNEGNREINTIIENNNKPSENNPPEQTPTVNANFVKQQNILTEDIKSVVRFNKLSLDQAIKLNNFISETADATTIEELVQIRNTYQNYLYSIGINHQVPQINTTEGGEYGGGNPPISGGNAPGGVKCNSAGGTLRC